jgi:hypothetical protein
MTLKHTLKLRLINPRGGLAKVQPARFRSETCVRLAHPVHLDDIGTRGVASAYCDVHLCVSI